jgi:VWFA-related protein
LRLLDLLDSLESVVLQPRFRFGVLLSLLSLTALDAQQQPTFRAGATLVRVDVTVVDRDGNPVTTLAAEDFEVEEDGVPQTVEACKLVSADGAPAPGDGDSLAIRSPEHAAAEAARDDVRVFLIFWDEYHINQFASAIRGREELGEFLSAAFGPTDLVALMDPLTPTDALEFTRDHDGLAQRIRKLSGRLGQYLPTRSAAEEAMMERGDVARLRTEVTLSALQSAAVHLGSIREGRKSILFISEGFPLRSEAMMMMQDVIKSANTNNTAIYTLDPRGLGAGAADVLRSLADNTGGEAIVNANEPRQALRQIVKDSSAFYLIGYTPTRAASDDGKFHEIRVKVRRPRVNVRARRGYWAPSAEDVERIAKASAAPAVPADVLQALGALSSARPERSMDFWVGTSRAADGSAQVNVAWAARGRRAAAVAEVAQAVAAVAVSIPSGTTKQTFEAPLDAQRLSFPARPGPLQVSISSRNAAGEVLEEESRAVTVPDFSANGLAISSPVVLRAQNVGEFRTLSAAADPVPFAGREFVRTDRLLIRFTRYGNPQATLSARLLSREQQVLVTLPVMPLAGSDAIYQIDLPLASVARGDYLLSIDGALNDERATALVPLRVVS